MKDCGSPTTRCGTWSKVRAADFVCVNTTELEAESFRIETYAHELLEKGTRWQHALGYHPAYSDGETVRSILLLAENAKFESFFIDIAAALKSHRCEVCYAVLSNETPNNSELKTIYERIPHSITGQVKYLQQLRHDIVLTTITALGHPRFPKSQKVGNYSHLFHSLNSPLYSYKKNSFTQFDTLHSTSDIMSNELEFMFPKSGNHDPTIYKSGYTRLTYLRKKFARIVEVSQKDPGEIKLTIAPTWGGQSIFEAQGIRSLHPFYEACDKLYLRPHPMTSATRKWRKLVSEIAKEDSSKVEVITNTSESETLLHSDYLVTDWSGIAMEFALATGRPSLYIDLPQKLKDRRMRGTMENAIERKFRQEAGFVLTDFTSLTRELLDSISSRSNEGLSEWLDRIYNVDSAPGAVVTNLLSG